jgi:hypothetical protein
LSEKAARVTHKHFSTKFLRNMTRNNVGEYFCSSCKRAHGSQPTPRVKLCLSGSTLHMFFAPPANAQLRVQYEVDAVHIDYITIPGAKIETLQQAFRIEYGKETRGIDVLVVAGLNNILRGDSVEALMRKIDLLRNTVMKQSTHFHPESPNTFAVATLLYAPLLCWFPDDGPLPSPYYRNRLEEMQWLNTELLRYNQANGVPNVPHVHKYGVRRDNRTNRDMYGNITVRHKVDHRWEQWREEGREDKLHLDDERRMMLGRMVNKYYRFNTN